MRSRATGTNPRFERNRRAVHRQRAFVRRRRRSNPQRFRFTSARPRRCMASSDYTDVYLQLIADFWGRILVRPMRASYVITFLNAMSNSGLESDRLLRHVALARTTDTNLASFGACQPSTAAPPDDVYDSYTVMNAIPKVLISRAMAIHDAISRLAFELDVLGFERLHDGMWNGVPTFIGKGNTGIALFPANEEPKTSAHREIRMLHLAFRADRENFLAAQRELKEARNQIRIPGSRNRALDLFPRSRRPPARDYDVRGRLARRTSLFVMSSHCAKSKIVVGQALRLPATDAIALAIAALRDAGAAVR